MLTKTKQIISNIKLVISPYIMVKSLIFYVIVFVNEKNSQYITLFRHFYKSSIQTKYQIGHRELFCSTLEVIRQVTEEILVNETEDSQSIQ